jgi:AcrR family transcriptional regulator
LLLSFKKEVLSLSGYGMTPAKPKRRAPDMQAKTIPLQERSRQTYELILANAAALLEEVGVERLSTNLICKRAHLTPPALYRYFPNKYALLKELGSRLMQAQDEAVFAWIDAGGLDTDTPEAAFASNLAIQTRVTDITRAQPGALWILRALRAVPALRAVRIESRGRVADRLLEALTLRYPSAPPAELRRTVRLNLELAYAVTEMVLEEPDQEPDAITADFSRLIVGYYARFS